MDSGTTDSEVTMNRSILRCAVPFLALSLLPPPEAAADGILAPGKQWFTQQPSFPPLDTPLLFGRKTTTELCRDCTGEILSLIYEQGAIEGPVHLWPLYVQLDTASAAGTATGTNARIYNRGAGWAAAHHGEAIGYAAGATNIGFNGELSPMVPGTRMIGLNLQAKNGYGNDAAGQWSDAAVNIQSDDGVGWKTGIEFDKLRTQTGIDFGPESAGEQAIRIRGNYGIGLDMGNSAIRLNSGNRICFEETSQVCLRYNARRARLEFLNGTGLLAYLNVAKASRRCLNC
jgi:hypothetical protein